MAGVKLTTLKLTLIQKGITQREISASTRIPEGKLSHFIHGRLSISPEERALVCNVLKIKDEVLFKELYDKDPVTL